MLIGLIISVGILILLVVVSMNSLRGTGGPKGDTPDQIIQQARDAKESLEARDRMIPEL